MINRINITDELKAKAKPHVYIIRALSYIATVFTVAILIGILADILFLGLPAINWRFLSTTPDYLKKTFGILPLIINTVYVVVIGLAVSMPLGLGCAIYLAEYAKKSRFTEAIRYCIEILAGIPSIVYGLFGATFFVLYLKFDYSMLAGGCTVAVIVLPVIIRTSEEAIKAVESGYREAAMSLGIGKVHIIGSVLLPSAMPGIITGAILSVGRMIGESAALIFTSGTGTDLPSTTLGHIVERGSTLSMMLYTDFTERPLGMKDSEAYATAAVVIIIVLILNLIIMASSSALNKKGKSS